LAVIAILAAVLTPRVISVIARGKIDSTAQSLATLKTATTDYIVKNGSLPLRDGTGALIPQWPLAASTPTACRRLSGETVLLRRRNTVVRSKRVNRPYPCAHPDRLSAAVVAAPSATVGGNNFDLDRDATTPTSLPADIVSAFIPSGDWRCDRIESNPRRRYELGTGADIVGRCTYSASRGEQHSHGLRLHRTLLSGNTANFRSVLLSRRGSLMRIRRRRNYVP